MNATKTYLLRTIVRAENEERNAEHSVDTAVEGKCEEHARRRLLKALHARHILASRITLVEVR